MKIVLGPLDKNFRRLISFLLLSLLVHIAILIIIRPQEKILYASTPHSFQVYLSAPAVLKPKNVLKKSVRIKSANNKMKPTTRSQTDKTIQNEKIIAKTPKTDFQIFDAENLIESAKNIAKIEAKKTQQDIAAVANKHLNSPVGLLAQYLKRPHNELRLANGMTKIITSAGAVCFQSVPLFAHESPELFGIPISCP